jgi:hypothetical protein
MEQVLLWLEESRMSVAIAGSQYMYPAILAAHGVGMALVVGLNTAMSLRVLGVAPTLPLAAMTRFAPVMWFGLWVNVVSGALLSAAGATRVLVDPVFYLKMVFVGLGVINLRLLQRALLQENGGQSPVALPIAANTAVVSIAQADRTVRMMAVASIVLWAGAITLGRLMAYTFFRFWQ